MTRPIAALAGLLVASPALAQWDPFGGDWGKSDQRDLRVMTWNVENGVASDNTNRGDNFTSSWNAIVRVIAAMRPDVLIMQECGNGDGTFVLTQQVEELFHGGPTTPTYIQLYAPGYDLPHIFVSEVTDNFNRNVIVSRYPFADLSGDGEALLSNFFHGNDPAAPYQQGGNGGIRGYMFAEIDLPDADYAGDVVVGNGHLKAFGDSGSFNQRVQATGNIAYFIDYYFNGAGTGVSNPNNTIFLPFEGQVLDPNTPVVWGGDINQSNHSFPATTLWRGGVAGGTDGTDRDGSDASPDFAFHPISGDTSTQSSSKLDYLIWQDSIAQSRREFVFRSSGTGVTAERMPFPVDGFEFSHTLVSTTASDHRPVIVDLILPEAVDPTCGDADFAEPFGALDFNDVIAFLTAFGAGDPSADLAAPMGVFDFNDVVSYLNAFAAGCL